MWKAIIRWFKIIRPGTLFASISPVIIGLIIAAKRTDINYFIAAITLISAVSIQIFSNLVNDYFDYKRGLDKSGRLGPKRALAEGTIDIKSMKKSIYITLAIAIISGGYLVISGGVPILLIGVFSILFAWLYTATEHSLSYLGIADIFVFIFFGLLATTGTTYLQTHTFVLKSLYCGCVCGSIATCILIVNNLRDIDVDRENNKNSFVVRFGKKAGEMEYLFFVLLTLVFSYLAFNVSWCMLIALFGLLLFFKVIKSNGKEYNKCLLLTGLWNVIFIILIIIDKII